MRLLSGPLTVRLWGADTLFKVKCAVEKATEEKEKEREKEMLVRESPAEG